MHRTDRDTGKPFPLRMTSALQSDLERLRQQRCNHATTEVRERTYSNGSKHLHQQCLKCGESLGSAIPRSQFRSDTAPFDHTIDDRYAESVKNLEEAIIQKHIRIQKFSEAEDRAYYEVYLNSQRWKDKRNLVMKRCGEVCEGCGESRATEVHHITYAHKYAELLFELVGLCKQCHQIAHDRDVLLGNFSASEVEFPCINCIHMYNSMEYEGMCDIFKVPCRNALASERMCGPEFSHFEEFEEMDEEIPW